MGLMRNRNLEEEYLSAIESLGLEVDFDADEEETDKEKNTEENK